MMDKRVHDLTGQVFGDLTVVRYGGTRKTPNGTRYTSWFCVCSCGEEALKRAQDLKKGLVRSCGCKKGNYGDIRKAGYPKWVAYMYASYKSSAKQGGKSFNLTVRDFYTLAISNCHYCGSGPIEKDWRSWDITFSANGIDRIDSSIGYEVGNVVTCCEKCNRMKMALPVQEFLDHVRRIALFQGVQL